MPIRGYQNDQMTRNQEPQVPIINLTSGGLGESPVCAGSALGGAHPAQRWVYIYAASRIKLHFRGSAERG